MIEEKKEVLLEKDSELEFLTALESVKTSDILSGNTLPIIIPSTAIEKFNAKKLNCIETVFVLDSIELGSTISEKNESTRYNDVLNPYKGQSILHITVNFLQKNTGDKKRRIISKSWWLPEPYVFDATTKKNKLLANPMLEVKAKLADIDQLSMLYREVTKKDANDNGKELEFDKPLYKDLKAVKREKTEFYEAYSKEFGAITINKDTQPITVFKYMWEMYFRNIVTEFKKVWDEIKENPIYVKVIAYGDDYIIPDEAFNMKLKVRKTVFERVDVINNALAKECTLTLNPATDNRLAESLILGEGKKSKTPANKPAGGMGSYMPPPPPPPASTNNNTW